MPGTTTLSFGSNPNANGTGTGGMPAFYVRSTPSGRPYTVTQLTYTFEWPVQHNVNAASFTSGMGTNFEWAYLGPFQDASNRTRHKYQLSLKAGVTKSAVSQATASLGYLDAAAPFTKWSFSATPASNVAFSQLAPVNPTVTYSYFFTDMDEACNGSSANPITGVEKRSW
ncbi:MAG: hypothetical protein ACI379_03790 [Nocardioides sp.]|uniref:hypothetical protein n=1 Tax=Nocardioides sp. TaxID=35761 RepID=UPI003F1272F3